MTITDPYVSVQHNYTVFNKSATCFGL